MRLDRAKNRLWLVMAGCAVLLAGCATTEEKKAETDVYLQLGIRYLNLNRLEAAKENLERVIAQDGNNIQFISD